MSGSASSVRYRIKKQDLLEGRQQKKPSPQIFRFDDDKKKMMRIIPSFSLSPTRRIFLGKQPLRRMTMKKFLFSTFFCSSIATMWHLSINTLLSSISIPVHHDTGNDVHSSKHTIIGLVGVGDTSSNLNLKEYKQFVGSLRHHGYIGKIIMGIRPSTLDDPTKRHTKEKEIIMRYLHSQGVTVKEIRTIPCDNNGGGISGTRIRDCIEGHPGVGIGSGGDEYILASELLSEECEDCDEEGGSSVLISPIAGVSFQSDPFININNSSERYKVGDGGDGADAEDETTILRFFEYPVDTRDKKANILRTCSNFNWDVPLLSSVAMGTRKELIAYLDVFMKTLDDWTERGRRGEPDGCIINSNIIGNGNSNDSTEGLVLAVQNFLYYNGMIRAKVYPPSTAAVILPSTS